MQRVSAIWTYCHTLSVTPKGSCHYQFCQKEFEKCEYLPKQYTQNNYVESKKTFVRVLQDMNVLPQDNDSNHYMQDNIIISTVMDNVLISQEAISSDEWQITPTIRAATSQLQSDKIMSVHMNNRNVDECKNNFDMNDIKPTCIWILNAEDHDKSVISYDVEVYEGTNDSIVSTCLTIPQNPRDMH